MRDTLKMMRFDSHIIRPLFRKQVLPIALVFAVVSLLVFPLGGVYLMMSATVLTVPLQNIPERSGFNKLYGILPVSRKAVQRGRFLLIYLILLAGELGGLLLMTLSGRLRLIKLMPYGESAFAQEMLDFVKSFWSFAPAVVGFFGAFVLILTFVEMMGQIFGRENTMKILVLTLVALVALIMGFIALSMNGILPMLHFSSSPHGSAFKYFVVAAVQAGALAVTVLFGEITASVMAKREL